MTAEEVDNPKTVPKKESKTIKIDTSVFNPEVREKLNKQDANASARNTLIMFLPNESEPLTITVKDTIVIGRSSPSEHLEVGVDLTKYHAVALGVSRFHAEISTAGGRYQIKDLGSTNGTWINNIKIAPYRLVQFKSGDTVRLGHLPIMIG